MESENTKRTQAQNWRELSEFKVMEWLFWLRTIMVIAQSVAILLVIAYMDLPLPLWPAGLAPVMLLAFNLMVYWRLEAGRSVSPDEISLHLLFDLLVFTFLLYWTGGSANPFVSGYLVPIALAATFGSLRYALGLGLVSVLMYSILMVKYVPLPAMDGRFGGDFSLHVFGMWLSFLISAAITIAFVSSLAGLARKRAIALKQAEQNSLNDQHVVALGALAAGAAHELGTPLSNIGMLADELINSDNTAEELTQFSNSLKQQIEICRAQIGLLREQANIAQSARAQRYRVDRFISQVLDRFSAMRSDMRVTLNQPPSSDGYLVSDPALSQTLLSLLNNAADASLDNGKDKIEVSYKIQAGYLSLTIDDFGKGLSEIEQAMVGAVPFSSKDSGLGIGLLLSQANISRLGGSLRLDNRESGSASGVRTEIKIPIVRQYDE